MKVSIVTVCKNAENSIRETIESVISQADGNNVEYIVIDGDSVDRTVSIINEYRDKIHSFVCEEDHGIYDAMNKGTRLATGDIIAFLNSGDFYENGVIDKIITIFSHTDADVVYGNALIVDNGRIIGDRKADPDVSDLLYSNIACHQAVFVKTELQKAYEFELQYRFSADRCLLAKLFMAGKRFFYYDENLVYFDNNGISSRNVYECMLDSCRVTYDLVKKYSLVEKRIIEDNKKSVFLYKFWSDVQKNEGQIREHFKHFFQNQIGEARDVVIWGVGEYGKRIAELIEDSEIRICGFIDTNSNVGHYKEYRVMKPKDVQLTSSETILISPRNHTDEIIKQIKTEKTLETAGVCVFVDLVINYEVSRGITIESILFG